MKANIEKLKELTLAELITINQFNIATFNYISEIKENKRTEAQISMLAKVNAIGYEVDGLVSEKLNEFIIE
jgi:hypothetical protein